MKVSGVKLFEVGLLVAAAAVLGVSALYSPFDYPQIWTPAAAGFAFASLATLTGFAMTFRREGSKAFHAIAIAFLVKLLLLVAGTVIFAKLPEWGDYKAYAFGFIGGFFLMGGVAAIFLLRAMKREAKHA